MLQKPLLSSLPETSSSFGENITSCSPAEILVCLQEQVYLLYLSISGTLPNARRHRDSVTICLVEPRKIPVSSCE